MSLFAVRCTQCGGNIEVDDAKRKSKCRYCGAIYIDSKKTTYEFEPQTQQSYGKAQTQQSYGRAQSQQFYKLNTNAPYLAETNAKNNLGAGIPLTIVGSLLAFSVLISVILAIIPNATVGYVDIPFMVIRSVISAVLLSLGIIFLVKYKKAKAALNEIALAGYVTFGKISNVEVPFPFGHRNYYRTVTLDYKFIDNNGQLCSGSSKSLYAIYSPIPYQIGQEVAVLFYQGKSFVLKRYELIKSDETEYRYAG